MSTRILLATATMLFCGAAFIACGSSDETLPGDAGGSGGSTAGTGGTGGAGGSGGISGGGAGGLGGDASVGADADSSAGGNDGSAGANTGGSSDAAPDAPADGQCDNGKSCSSAGSICRLSTVSCNATDKRCSGTVQTHPLDCKQDILGIPRCTAVSDLDCAADGGVAPGTACATSADCCNMPCVPNPSGNPPFVCGGASCVPAGGSCTTTADCCAGVACSVPSGALTGTCGTPGGGPDGGTGGTGGSGGSTACAEYGQLCTVDGDCCGGVPCTAGRCLIEIH